MAENYARLRQAQSTVQRAARLLVTLVVGDCLMHRRNLSGVSSAGLAERAWKALQPDVRGCDVGALGRSQATVEHSLPMSWLGDFPTATAIRIPDPCSARAVAPLI